VALAVLLGALWWRENPPQGRRTPETTLPGARQTRFPCGVIAGGLERRAMNEVLRRLLFLPIRRPRSRATSTGLHYFVIITTFISVHRGGGLTASSSSSLPPPFGDADHPTHRAGAVDGGALSRHPLIFFTLWFFLASASSSGADAAERFHGRLVMGKKWMWKFAYPDGPNSINVLRVPRGRNVAC